MRLSPLAYTNQYWVNTVYNGIAYQYLIFIDGDVIKQTLLSQEETTEPSGTRVVVQIKTNWNSISEWNQAILIQSSYFNGAVVSVNGIKQVQVNSNDILKTTNISSERLHFVLGCVYYDIDWNNFKNWENLSYLQLGIYIGLDEEVYPTPSRESIYINDISHQVLNEKLKRVAELITEECEKTITDAVDLIDRIRMAAKDEVRFEMLGKEIGIRTDVYKSLCSSLNKTPLEIVTRKEFTGREWHIWSLLTRSFTQWKGSGSGLVYSETKSITKSNFLKEKGKTLVTPTKILDFAFPFNFTKGENETDIEFKQRKNDETRELSKELKGLFIEKYYEKFPEEEFAKWKKERKQVKKKSEGITYFRSHVNDPTLCTEDKGTISLDTFPLQFYADKQTANKYWHILNKIYGNKFIILTKPGKINLMELTSKPSKFLKTMCTEALKTRVHSILGNEINSPYILDFLKSLNPLLFEYIKDVSLKNAIDMNPNIRDALIEAGELHGFGKDEIKLRYIEHHLNKLKLIKRLGFGSYNKKLEEEDQQIVKRLYILERLVEKKYPPVEQVNENQLTLQLD